MLKALNPRDDINKQYVSRKEGWRRHTSIEDRVDVSARQHEDYKTKSKERLILSVSLSPSISLSRSIHLSIYIYNWRKGYIYIYICVCVCVSFSVCLYVTLYLSVVFEKWWQSSNTKLQKGCCNLMWLSPPKCEDDCIFHFRSKRNNTRINRTKITTK